MDDLCDLTLTLIWLRVQLVLLLVSWASVCPPCAGFLWASQLCQFANVLLMQPNLMMTSLRSVSGQLLSWVLASLLMQPNLLMTSLRSPFWPASGVCFFAAAHSGLLSQVSVASFTKENICFSLNTLWTLDISFSNHFIFDVGCQIQF